MLVRDILRWTLWILGGTLIIMTLVPLTNLQEWWVQALAFPRVQISWLAAIIAFLLLAFFREQQPSRWLAGALLLAIVYQFYEIYPYTTLAAEQTLPAVRTDSAIRLRILTANVYMNNRDIKPFLEQVKSYDPDVVLLCEPDEWWEKRMRSIETAYRYSVKEPLSNTYGMLLYSRLPLSDAQVEYIIDDTIPSIHATLTLRSGAEVKLHCLHPRPPIPSNDTEERDAELVLVGQRVKESNQPTIIIGDFNDVAWSETTELFQEISQTLDPRIGRGTFNTFNADYFFLRFPLDHIFHTTHFRLARIERMDDINSDHFPMFAELSFEPERRYEQEEPQAEPEDIEESQEKMQEMKEKK